MLSIFDNEDSEHWNRVKMSLVLRIWWFYQKTKEVCLEAVKWSKEEMCIARNSDGDVDDLLVGIMGWKQKQKHMLKSSSW
jgi:hypothetical protein